MTTQRVAVVGGGAIGASWAALLISRGVAVTVADPAAEVEETLRGTVERYLGELTGPGAEPADRFDFTQDVAAAAAAADVVLESGPERLAVKRELFRTLDESAGPAALLLSSSSGFPPSTFQDACARHPDRVLVAHPFNPPHLVPLVEVVGGRLTSEDAVEATMAFFTDLGRRPIRLHRELPGHVANRLQAALWREAYHLVGTGAVSVADVDTAIAAGPGLRWALLGPFATQHLSGGRGGIRHVLEHLGPPMVDWWRDLGDPELTPELADAVAAGVDAELAGTEREELLGRRDRALRELLDLKARLGLH